MIGEGKRHVQIGKGNISVDSDVYVGGFSKCSIIECEQTISALVISGMEAWISTALVCCICILLLCTFFVASHFYVLSTGYFKLHSMPATGLSSK